MASRKSSFPGISKSLKNTSSQNAVTENIELLTGQRGDGSNRALLVKDLINLDDMKRQALIKATQGNYNTGGLPITNDSGIETPTAPVNLQGTGGFTFIALTWDHPNYKGHAYAEIYRSDTDSFSSAAKIATEVTDIFSDSVNMGSGYYYWVRFVNKADMKGPTQGASGLYVETQQSAEQILAQIDGKIEKSHLGEFLTTEVDKIPDFEVAIPPLQAAIPPLQAAIPPLQAAMFDADGLVSVAKAEAVDAKAVAENALADNQSMALNLIDAALLSDTNWQNNTQKLVSIESSIEGVKATIESEFYTKTEANEAIAAAAQTIQTMIEANGTALSGDIATTYYTKTTADDAMALADTALKAAIEDPNGTSLGATVNNDYYTKVSTDSAIAIAGDTLKANIEDPNGTSLGATLFTNYYTKTSTDSAIANADLALKSVIEDINGGSLGATLYNGYYTKSNTDSAISNASSLLKSEIEDVNGSSIGATLFQNYQTKADNNQTVATALFQLTSDFTPAIEATLDNAIANDVEADRQRVISAELINKQQTLTDANQAVSETLQQLSSQYDDSQSSILTLNKSLADNTTANARNLTQLKSSIDDVSSNLEINYYTSVNVDSAISQAKSLLKSEIEDPNGSSVGADLQTNYYTKTLADTAISNATTQLKSQLDKDIANVSADVYNNFYTKTGTSNAIASADTALKAAIEDPNGSSVGADLQTNYYTKVSTDLAIAQATTQLKSDIENTAGNSVGADLYNNYYTKTTTDTAIATADLVLKSAIEDPNGSSVGANLQTNYYTKVGTDTAISNATTQLKSDIEDQNGSSIGADLYNNFYTKTTADAAISNATTQLKSEIEDPNGSSVGADLYNNFYTKTTADAAIAAANTILKSEIEDAAGNSVGASLQTLSETVATNQGEFSAMWGVKTTVAGITASFGLVNDGVDPLLAVKGAKFAVIDDADPTTTIPVFAVSNGKTVMNTAIIDQAFIQSLVTDNLLSNRVLVGSELNAPSINYNPATGVRSNNFSVDPSGNMEAESAVLDSATLKAAIITTANGDIVVNANGDIDGAWIKNLMVDYLQIQNQAITSPHSVEIVGTVGVTGSNSTTFTIGSYVGGGIQFSIAINAYRYMSSSGNDEVVWCKVSVKSGISTIKQLSYPVPATIQNTPNNGSACGMFDEVLLSPYIGNILTVVITFSSAGLGGGQTISYNAQGFISYAKR